MFAQYKAGPVEHPHTCPQCGGVSKFEGRCADCIIADFDDYDDDEDCDPEGPAFECAGFVDGTGFYCPLWGTEECDWECLRGGMGLSNLAYIAKAYGVPAKRGQRVRYTGDKGPNAKPREGSITGAEGAHLRIRMDGDSFSNIYHPTWELEYLSC